MPTFEDARKIQWRAKESLEKRDWSQAIYQAQQCVDLSVKAFFQVLGIKYELKHRLKDKCFEDALEQLKSKFKKEYEVKRIRATLAKAKVWMDILATIRNYAGGYTPLNVPTGEIFVANLQRKASHKVSMNDVINGLLGEIDEAEKRYRRQ